MRFMGFICRLGTFVLLVELAALTHFSAAYNTETIETLASDCSTPRTLFTIGDSVCAVAKGSPFETLPRRRFEWIAPNGTVFQLGPDIESDPSSNSIALPSTGPFAQPGIWSVKTVDVSNNGYCLAQFLVQASNGSSADLSASMFAPFQVSADANVTFTLFLKNNGPNPAQNIQIKIGGASATLVSAEQTSGPRLTWQSGPQAANGNTIGAIESLAVNGEAALALVYHIGPRTQVGARVSSTAIITSSTAELNPADNVATATSLLALQPCALDCPLPLVTQKQAGQCGAAVTFAAPAYTGSNCGALICNPVSGSFFPVGTTSVICVGDSGSPCSFTVTVDDPSPAALSCPGDATATEDSPGMGLAVVKFKAPVGNDNCTADPSACSPPSGSSFPVGTTTVSCEVRGGGALATCSFTVTVEPINCALSSSSGIAVSNRPNECGRVVHYPLPQTDGNCGTMKCTPPSGSVFPLGETTVSCITTAGSGATFIVTVQDTQAPIIGKISADPSSLSPLNGKLRDVTIDYSAQDNCSGELSCTLSVSSTEPWKKDSPPDWDAVDAHHVRLRADRGPNGKGRVYSITITCQDLQGNLSSKTITMTVPPERR